MRIRVLLDITKPLKRQKKIKKQGGDSSFIKFKYERLGNEKMVEAVHVVKQNLRVELHHRQLLQFLTVTVEQ